MIFHHHLSVSCRITFEETQFHGLHVYYRRMPGLHKSSLMVLRKLASSQFCNNYQVCLIYFLSTPLDMSLGVYIFVARKLFSSVIEPGPDFIKHLKLRNSLSYT